MVDRIEEEFQEAEILWPDSDSDPAKPPHVHLRRRPKRSKRRLPSVPIKIPAAADATGAICSYSWTEGFTTTHTRTHALKEGFGDGLGEWVWAPPPPHILVAHRVEDKVAYSVCTGNGRTLKGRDLRQVRDAVLRLTGFLEI